jgi:hypothetical protein
MKCIEITVLGGGLLRGVEQEIRTKFDTINLTAPTVFYAAFHLIQNRVITNGLKAGALYTIGLRLIWLLTWKNFPMGLKIFHAPLITL